MAIKRTGMAAIPVYNAGGIVTRSVEIIRPSNTDAYAIGDTIAAATPEVGGQTFTDVVNENGQSAILTDMLIVSSNPAATPLQGEIWIFDTAVTAVADNAALAVSDAEIKTLVAKIPFVMAVGVNNNNVHLQSLMIGLTCVTKDLYFLVKTLNAYAPANGEVITVRAKFAPQG